MTHDVGEDLSVSGEPGASAGTEQPPARRAARVARARRRRALLVLGALALLLLAFVIVAGWFLWQLDPPGGPGARVRVEVASGWGIRQTGDALADHGVIGSSLAFQLWARMSGTGFQAGAYDFRRESGVREAAAVLRRGPLAPPHHTLALPPGLTIRQIAERVGRLPGHDRDAFLALAESGVVRSRFQPAGVTSLEGLTWPDTYFIGTRQTDEEILRLLVTTFDARAAAAGITSYEQLVVASLVQAEVGTTADAPLVAAVVANRLARGMLLQIDATLCYARGGCPPVPSNADKQLDSPYNTYRAAGLPPTPIMTVTTPAMAAAVRPADVPYLYYVTGDDGVTRFGSTLQEHERNIREHGVSGE